MEERRDRNQYEGFYHLSRFVDLRTLTPVFLFLILENTRCHSRSAIFEDAAINKSTAEDGMIARQATMSANIDKYKPIDHNPHNRRSAFTPSGRTQNTDQSHYSVRGSSHKVIN